MLDDGVVTAAGGTPFADLRPTGRVVENATLPAPVEPRAPRSSATRCPIGPWVETEYDRAT